MLIDDIVRYVMLIYVLIFFVFKQKTAYDMRISDWSSDVCSSDLKGLRTRETQGARGKTSGVEPCCSRSFCRKSSTTATSASSIPEAASTTTVTGRGAAAP